MVALNFTNNAIYPLYVTHSGGSAAQVGLFMATYALAAVLSRPFIGFLLDRFGIKPVLMLGSLLIALPPLGYSLLLGTGLSPLVWLLRVVQGVGFGAHFSAFFTLAAATAPEHRRTEAVAMYGISGLGANLIGPFIGEWLVRAYGLPSFFLAMCLFGMGAFYLTTRFRLTGNQTPSEPASHQNPGRAFRHKPLYFAFGLALLLSMSFASPQTFLAPLADGRGIRGFSLYFTGFAMAGIVVRLIGRKWSDRFGWRRILIPMFFLYALGLWGIFFSRTPVHLILSGLLTGSAHGLAFPAVTALGYTLAPARARGTSMALVTGMMDLGNFTTGVLFGQVAEILGYGPVFPLASLAPLTAMGLLAVHLLRHREHLAKTRRPRSANLFPPTQ